MRTMWVTAFVIGIVIVTMAAIAVLYVPAEATSPSTVTCLHDTGPPDMQAEIEGGVFLSTYVEHPPNISAVQRQAACAQTICRDISTRARTEATNRIVASPRRHDVQFAYAAAYMKGGRGSGVIRGWNDGQPPLDIGLPQRC